MSTQLEMLETKEDKAFREAVERGQSEINAGLGMPAEKAKADILNWRSRSEKFSPKIQK